MCLPVCMCCAVCAPPTPPHSADSCTLSPVTLADWSAAQREQTICGICQDVAACSRSPVRTAGGGEHWNGEPSAPIARCSLLLVLCNESHVAVCLQATHMPRLPADTVQSHYRQAGRHSAERGAGQVRYRQRTEGGRACSERSTPIQHLHPRLCMNLNCISNFL